MIYSAVDCAEEHGTVSENVDDDKTTCAVTLRCAWGDRWALAADLLSNHRVWPALSTWAFPPKAHAIGIKPAPTDYDTVGQACVYLDALVSVNYDNTKDDEDAIAESIEPTVEFLQEDYRGFRWGSSTGDPLLENEAPGRQVRGFNLVRTIYKVKAPVPTALITLPGTVNNTAYTSKLLGLSFAEETLLFDAPQLDRKFTATGSDGFDIKIKHVFKAEGWNKYWRQKTQSYEYIYDLDDNIYRSYPLANHAAFLY